MSLLVPLQVPGGPELLIIFILFLFLAVPALLVVAVIVYLLRRQPSGSDDRVADLEQRVDELETRLEDAVGDQAQEDGTAETADSGADAGEIGENRF